MFSDALQVNQVKLNKTTEFLLSPCREKPEGGKEEAEWSEGEREGEEEE